MSALVAVLLLAPHLVVAQGSVYARMSDDGASTADYTAFLCGSTAATAPSSISVGCTAPIVNGVATTSASASAIGGVLRASSGLNAVFNGTAPTATFGSQVTVQAGARWDDQAFVTPVAGATGAARLNITFGVTGFTASTGPVTTAGDGLSAYGQFLASSSTPVTDAAVGNSISSGTSPGFPNKVMNSDFVFSMMLDQSGASSPFWYQFATFALGARFPNDPNPLVGSVVADFSHTAVPLFFQVLDADGNDVTAAYNVRFANGMTFGAPSSPTTTPEPGSAAMLGTGILGLVRFRNSRRKRG